MLKYNSLSVKQLYSNTYGPAISSATMSRDRFYFLLKNLSFDDELTRDERWQQDRFAAIREVFEEFNQQCMKCLIPGDYISLDETLYPTRNKISFKQYNPNKPAKYGLLFCSINAARYLYTFVTAPYCGKLNDKENTEYYVCGTADIVKHLVSRLSNVHSLKGRNISFDRLYTSIPLVLWLHERLITYVGTMKANRKGIPAEIKELKHCTVLSTEVYWQVGGPLTLSSCVVSTSSSKK